MSFESQRANYFEGEDEDEEAHNLGQSNMEWLK